MAREAWEGLIKTMNPVVLSAGELSRIKEGLYQYPPHITFEEVSILLENISAYRNLLTNMINQLGAYHRVNADPRVADMIQIISEILSGRLSHDT